ncbi:MAG: GNAT family N-acetyltransferase [Pyrinomonadaceae bacterium]
MTIEVTEHDLTDLTEYATITIAFEVRSLLDVTEDFETPGTFILSERHLSVPYVKDYDAIAGERPTDWARRFDLSNWRLFRALLNDVYVGGAIVAVRTPELTMLQGRDDLAVIWDIRVLPEIRGRGVGTALLRQAENWARVKSCRHFKVETQNINVGGCRFYAALGFELIEVNRHAYSEFPDEIQLIWQKVLDERESAG